MNKVGIFYGSTTGTTEEIARKIGEKLGLSKSDVHDAAKISEELVNQYDVLILGTATWGDGEQQDDWYDGVKVLMATDLTNKPIALFGCGDSESYSDTFCGGMGYLYQDLKDSGCRFCGITDVDGYTFDASESVIDDKFIGLPIDDVNESDKTDARIDEWIEKLKKECLE